MILGKGDGSSKEENKHFLNMNLEKYKAECGNL